MLKKLFFLMLMVHGFLWNIQAQTPVLPAQAPIQAPAQIPTQVPEKENPKTTTERIPKAHAPFRISTVQFEGAKKNKDGFLRQLTDTRKGQVIDLVQIESDVQELNNASGIGFASYRLDTLNNEIALTFVIEEIKTLLPIVKFGGIQGNIWFQLGFVDINWQGKGQTLSAYYQNNDRRHSGQIFYRVPRYQNGKWGYSISLTKWSSREPLFFPEGTVMYDYDNNSIALSGIRHFGRQSSLEFGGTYFVEVYNKSEEQFFNDTPGPESLTQPKFLSKLEFQTNKLNYHYFYLNGHSWRMTYQNVFNTLDNTWFNSLQFQGRRFVTIGKDINLAFRMRLGISTNNNSPFAPFVADSHVNLRGVGNRIDRGTAQIVINAEYRHTLFHTTKWAGQAVAFVDMGSWRKPGGELTDIANSKNFREFVGGGVRLIYKKVFDAVLRIDYGVDVFDPSQRGVVIGLGQYF